MDNMKDKDQALHQLVRAIAAGDEATVFDMLSVSPDLARRAVQKGATRAEATEHFLADIGSYVYAGDTALHIAAAAYRADLARKLVEMGAKIDARNRRGAEPLHYAAIGTPGAGHRGPAAQAAMISSLVEQGGNPNAEDKNGVTPLHRAIRNRCALAVQALLEAGADANRRNGNGTTVLQLANLTTGRSGSGSMEAKAQQAEIIRLLQAAIHP